jgi:YggT family protein
MIIQLIQGIFLIYTILLLVRVLGGWVPAWNGSAWMRFVGKYTDPYLNLFRRFIPPLGVIDISPMLAFFALQLVEQGLLIGIRTWMSSGL